MDNQRPLLVVHTASTGSSTGFPQVLHSRAGCGSARAPVGVHREGVGYPQLRRGCPQLVHRVVHRFRPPLVDNLRENPSKFFSASPHRPPEHGQRVCTQVFPQALSPTYPVIRAGAASETAGRRCGQGNRGPRGPGTRGNGECRGRTAPAVPGGANRPRRGVRAHKPVDNSAGGSWTGAGGRHVATSPCGRIALWTGRHVRGTACGPADMSPGPSPGTEGSPGRGPALPGTGPAGAGTTEGPTVRRAPRRSRNAAQVSEGWSLIRLVSSCTWL